ncbi:MAG: S-layer homology domain-containing protein [Oscillospiraceae bacterium]|nr:S-layer homology domain-containing protein [Oscillospiraceae bacterium]
MFKRKGTIDVSKKKGKLKWIAVILAVASFLSVFTLPVTAAPEDGDLTIPAGQTSFSIELRVNESTPYSGIEFALTISGENVPAFTSFTPYQSGTTPSPFVSKNGLYYFGFYSPTGSNDFPAGDNLAGVLDFTGFTGNQAVVISVVQMSVIRVDENKQTYRTEKDAPAYVFTAQREGTVTNFYTVTFDPAGGARVDGGALTQTVPEGGAAVAPILYRSGYTYTWDKTFNNVTSNMTVMAQWTPSGGTDPNTYYLVTFNPAGGTRTGGGELVQMVLAGSAAVAPNLSRSGFTYGWDKTFSNVTSDMTVTAQWTPVVVANYTVTFNAAGGTRTGGGALTQTIPAGSAAVAPILSRDGYTYSWDKTFGNVTSDMTVTAIWTPIAVTNYTVTFDPAGGTRTGGGALVQSVASGGAATAPVVVLDGYSFNGWNRAFSNVTSDMTVTALWIEDDSNIGIDNPPDGGTKTHYFDDVTETLYSWALEAVDALAAAGVVKGTADRIYSPEDNIKRGDFILMLYRAYGLDEPFTENFPDVPTDTYYYEAIGSTKALDIARGYGDGQFLPEAPISREEMMALIDRTLDTIGKPLPRGSESDLTVFADKDDITDYARGSVAALVKSGIIVGDGAGVNPLAYTTRAEMAVALYRLMILTGDLVAG